MNEDNVVDFPKKKRVPDREQIADAAERTSGVFSSLALMAEITARVLKAVARELSHGKHKKYQQER